MSAFSRPDFVEEFAYRTRSNYYSLMIAQAKELDKPDTVKEYEQKLDFLKQEMAWNRYHVGDNYFEVTQLINSLIGLLIFPEQQYYDELKRKNLTLEKDFSTLNTIIGNKKDGSFFCSYKKSAPLNMSEEDQKNYFGSGGVYSRRCDIIRKSFEMLDPEEKSPSIILKHMRNAAAHERVGIFPVSRNERITSVVLEDIGKASIKKEKYAYFAKYETPPKKINSQNIREDLLFGYFRLEIDVKDLEMVLTEISNTILRIAREGY